MNLYDLSLFEASQGLARKEFTSVELTESVLARQQQTEPKLNSYITVTAELARQQAKAADARLQKGEATPLSGIPIGFKDLLCTTGIRTTAASRMLENFVPPYSASIAASLLDAGMVLVGKHNLDEFAMGSTNESSFFGPCKNPWDIKAIPGGSSGGSAASLAAGSCLAAIGSDTGGSIRQPSSHCGVVGLKPSYGLVSRFGIMPFASSLDQAGPMGRSVADIALLLENLVAHDPKDATSIPYKAPDYLAALNQDIKGLRLGVPEEYFVKGLDGDVEQTLRQALQVLEGLGARLVPISLPHTEYLISTYYIIATAEASSNLARYDGIRYGYSERPPDGDLEDMYVQTRSHGFGPEVMRRIILGTYVLSSGYYDAYYAKASQVRTLIIRDFMKAFAQVDAIAAPVAPHAALDLGVSDTDPITVYLRDIFTISCNLAGLPAMSLPAGFSKGNRPIGLQLMAPRFNESTLLRIGANFEKHTDYHKQRPNL